MAARSHPTRPRRMLGALALAALAGCESPDAAGATNLAACLPQELRGSCVEERMIAYQRCLDGTGACTYALDDGGAAGKLHFAWDNGASVTGGGDKYELRGASGALCTVAPLALAGCEGVRFTVDGLGFHICTDRTSDSSTTFYACDDDEPIALASATLPQSALCTLGASMDTSYLEACVDAGGRRFGEPQGSGGRIACPDTQCAIAGTCHAEGARDVPAADGCNTCQCSGGRSVCTQGACGGEVGARCFDDVPCRQGLHCRNVAADATRRVGYCTLACTTAECPAGTSCQRVATGEPEDPPDQCLRECASQDDCDPFGSLCSLVRGDSGYCF